MSLSGAFAFAFWDSGRQRVKVWREQGNTLNKTQIIRADDNTDKKEFP